MLQQSGNDVILEVFYTTGGVGKTGLLDVKVTVYKDTGNTPIISNATCFERADGFYRYTLEAPANGYYRYVFKTADATVDQKHIAGEVWVGKAGVNNLDAAITSRPSATQIDTQLSNSHGAGSWQSYAVNALILRLSEDELNALLDGQAKKPISLFRGDSLVVEISVLDADGNAVILGEATAKFTARESENSADAIIEEDLDIYDPTHGKMRLALTAEEMELAPDAYPADIEITFADGRVKTIWKSALEVKWDVGR